MNKELIFRALFESLIERDIPAFQEVLGAHVEAVNKLDLAKRSKISRRTLYCVITPGGNPTLQSVSQVLHALYGGK